LKVDALTTDQAALLLKLSCHLTLHTLKTDSKEQSNWNYFQSFSKNALMSNEQIPYKKNEKKKKQTKKLGLIDVPCTLLAVHVLKGYFGM
jgi:hypothetical protein